MIPTFLVGIPIYMSLELYINVAYFVINGHLAIPLMYSYMVYFYIMGLYLRYYSTGIYSLCRILV